MIGSPIRAPGGLAPLIEAIGEGAVLRLLEKRGGTCVYVPGVKLTARRGLGRELGLDREQCERLQALLGNTRYKVPLARPWRALIYRRVQNLSYTQIALKLGVDEATVHRYLRDAGVTRSAAQLSMAL